MKQLPILLALILLLLTTPVQAALVVNTYTNDFSVSSPFIDTLKACACESRVDRFTVQNTGNFASTYNLEVTAEQPWFRPSIDSFSLAPGESFEFLVYLEPPCGTIGDYQYSVSILSSYGRERVLTRSLDVRQCQNLFLTVDGGTNVSNLCQPIEYDLTLKNVAEFADTFTLDFGSFNDYDSLERRDFYLQPNQIEKVPVTITPPCGLFGDVEIPFTITSEKNKVIEQRVELVTIINQFDHEIAIDTQTEICSRMDDSYTFTVTNLIDVPNTYDVLVSGPGFISYDAHELELDGLESKEVTLDLAPEKGDEGVYNVKVKVNSQYGEISKTRELQLDVFDCFAFDLGYVEQARAEDGAFTDVACCGEKVYELNIRNSGQTEETYNIEVDGPSWFAPEERTIRLEPSENRNVRFTASLPCTDETYDIPVKVSLTRHPEIAETVLFRVESQTQRTCHEVTTFVDTIRMDEEASVIPVIVRHEGLEGGTYTIDFEGELFSGTLEERFTLESGEEAVIHLFPRENITDYFDGKYLNTLLLAYEPLDITYRAPFWVKFNHVSELTKLWRSIVYYDYGSVSPCIWVTIILFALMLLALLWLLVVLVRKLHAGKRVARGGLIAARVLLAIGLIAAILALFLVPFPEKADLYEEPMSDSDGLLFQWYENERFTVNLDRYFNDPDMDILEYTATQPANVKVRIDDNIVTFIPERNWAGTEQIVFTASDQVGGITDSPIIGLSVLRRYQLTFGQWLNRYCTQLSLLFLAIVLLALLIIALLYTPTRRITYGEVLEPPKKPVVHTIVKRSGRKATLGAVPPIKEKKKRTMTAAQKATLSKALDRALVSSEEHEMKQVLRTHGKRETKENVATLQEALKAFKSSKAKPKNREGFYTYISQYGWLVKLEDAVEAAPVTSDDKRADRNLVSSEEHEMKQVLRTHGKRETKANVAIMQRALVEFKADKRSVNNRESFYAFLQKKNWLGRMRNK